MNGPSSSRPSSTRARPVTSTEGGIMLERILRFSVDHRWLVVLCTLGASLAGGYALLQLPIDAVPDITNRQVQVNAVAAALSPTEMEKQVTFPLETALAGIPGLE